jgi:hypothetical protein
MSRPKGSKNKVKTGKSTKTLSKGKTTTSGTVAAVMTRGRPKKVVEVAAPKRGRPPGSKNKTAAPKALIVVNVGSTKVGRGRPKMLKNMEPEEKLRAILAKGSSELYQEIMSRPKTRGRPKKTEGNQLINSIKAAIMKDVTV